MPSAAIERTARVAGMGVDRTKILVFAINGVLAALAGIFLAANLRSSAPTIGDPFTLKIVAACALAAPRWPAARAASWAPSWACLPWPSLKTA